MMSITYPQMGEREKGRTEGEERVREREREYYKPNGIEHYQ